MAKVTPIGDDDAHGVIWHALDSQDKLDTAVTQREIPFYIVHPRAKAKLAWDFLCLLLLVYCVIDVPFTLAFVGQDISVGNATAVLANADSIDPLSTGYGIWSFTLDMLFLADTFLNFFTAIAIKSGSHDEGEEAEQLLDISLKNIFRSYMSSWFFPDLISSLPLDTILVNIDIADAKSFLRIPRVLKVFRAIRLVKLLRLRRSSTYLASISHIVELNPGFIRIGKFFLIFLVLAHYLSCAMFFIGTLDSFDSFGNPTTWLTQTSIVNSNGESQQLALAPLAEQYLWTLYWTITTMTTVGFGDIHPITEAEIIMSILTMIIGGGVFSFIVGNTASLLTRLDSQSAELEDLLERVADFMQSNKIPLSLRDQCTRWIKFQHGNSVQIPKALSESLSESLRAELNVFVNRGFIERTAVLRRHMPSKRKDKAEHRDAAEEGARDEDADGRNRDDRFLGLLLEKCREEHYCPGEIIFLQGCKGLDMYFIEQGQVDITRQREDGSGSSCVLTTLYTGAVFGEASFLSMDNERRTYTARSRTWLKLKVINTKDLNAIATQFPRLKADFSDDLQQFSKQFEESMKLSMELDATIGAAVTRPIAKGEALGENIVESILDAAKKVADWKEPEKVHFPIHFGCSRVALTLAPTLSRVTLAYQVFFKKSKANDSQLAARNDRGAILRAASLDSNESFVESVDDVVANLNLVLDSDNEDSRAKRGTSHFSSMLDDFKKRVTSLVDTDMDRVKSFQQIRSHFLRSLFLLSYVLHRAVCHPTKELTLLHRSLTDEVREASEGVLFELDRQ